ncbi:helix-turn-helix domain-containing protein [Corallococcus llansteffanensis]|uniref:XRE family transcriptional regulator n=1 Tax=Corallococcus llansteffanensis TaxID=2316731 RepID=A0A3A8QWI9_9BACT|nr:helix-turn-helix transcriptional regulator [Corallococcus llansteffanensis]RKH67494.1 XRE family transcriptional regulator [Corallococcus llansteffanensis]
MYEAFAAELGHVIREARHRAGLRQDKVAEALQFPVPLYARMERGKLIPSVAVLRDLCLTLNVSSEALLHLAAPRAPGDAARQEDLASLRALLRRVRALPEARFQSFLTLLDTLEDA